MSESLNFNSVLLEISNHLTADELDQMKFLCRDQIGKRELEKIETGRRLFEVLSQRGKLAADNTEFVSDLLEKIHRPDLADRLRSFRASRATHHPLDEAERVKLDAATEVIVENLGRNWRKLGHKLHLAEVKLESIATRHPTDLEETAVELLKEWRKSRGAEARAEQLITALRACQLNMTADNVKSKIDAL
ncbi:FAS-associated death domain protein [Symphorus nematophorus]